MVDAVTTKQEVGNLRDHQPDGDTDIARPRMPTNRSWRRTRRFVLGDAVDRQCVERGEHSRATAELAIVEVVVAASTFFLGVVGSSRALGLARDPHPAEPRKATHGFW